MNRDEIVLYELLGKLKEALEVILEEAESDRDWSTVIEYASDALDNFED